VGDTAVVVATPAHRAGLEAQLRGEGLEEFLVSSTSRLITRDADETLARLLVDDIPDAQRFQEVIGGLLQQASQSGGRVRVFGEMVALLAATDRVPAALQLEALWNELQREQSFALVCAYPFSVLSADRADGLAAEVCDTHDRALPGESYADLLTDEERRHAIIFLQQKARRLKTEIAARAYAERELRRREYELRDFVDNGSIGLHWVGADGTILWANRAELDLLGYSAEEYIGRPIQAFYPDQEVISDILRRLSAGETVLDYAARMRCKDGSIKHVLINSNVLFENGQFVHTRCFTRDVTAQHQSERRVALQLAITSALAEASSLETAFAPVLASIGQFLNADVATLWLKDGGSIPFLRLADTWCGERPRLEAFVSASRTQTFAPGVGVPGSTWQTGQFVWLDDLEEFAKVVVLPRKQALQDAGLRSGVAFPVGSAGAIGAIEVFAREQRVADPLLEEVLVAAGRLLGQFVERCWAERERDRLLEREQAARADAEAALRSREEFLGIASHELRTPVTAIKATAQSALRARDRGLLTLPRAEHSLEGILHTASRMAVLTNDLLDVSRIQSGQLSLRCASVDLTALIRDIVQRWMGVVDAAPVIDLELPAAPLCVNADAGRLEQVLENLLSNAVKYSPAGGLVEVQLTREAEGALVTVQDCGIGLPPGAEDTIFEPFGRAPNAAARNLPGLGLGLYICRRIAELHGGHIVAESEGDGLGTTFYLWLPCSSGA
jgi:PAS domain S-box-containing protein